MSTDRTPPEFDDSDADEIVIEREPDSIEAAVGQFADEAGELADRQAAQLAKFQAEPAELPPVEDLRAGGPTIEQFVAAGYDAAYYPPGSYAVVHSEALDAYGATGVVPQAAIDRAKREERIRRGEELPGVILDDHHVVSFSFRAATCAPRHVPNCECTGDARSQP